MVHISLGSVDVNLLVVLRALLGERHVTRAAARVGLSQSATSHALSRLRELYDDPLLVRSGRALTLTPRAERLLPILERGLTDLSATLEPEPEFNPRTAQRAFTLGMADYTQAVMMGPLLRAIEREAPNVDLSVANLVEIEAPLLEGRLDVGVTVTGVPPHPQLASGPLFEDDFVCLVRKNHPHIRGQLTLARYLAARHVVVAPSGTAGSLVDSELARRGQVRRVALRVTNFLVAPLVVAETDFLSTMPRRLGARLAEHYGLRALPPPMPLPTFGFLLVWHPRLEHDPAQQWLRELVIRVSRSLPSPPIPRRRA